MSKVKFNVKEFEALRFDPRVQDFLLEKAEQVHQAAGGDDIGYSILVNKARKNRPGVTVIASSKHARRHNRKHHALVKALAKARSR